MDCHIRFSVRNCMLPSACTVFQGAPNPTSQIAGHWDCWLAASMRRPCQPMEITHCRGSGVQHALWSCARITNRIKRPSKPDEKFQCKRVGRAVPDGVGAESELEGGWPSESTAIAEPCHTVPCAWRRTKRCWLASEMACANQVAGAWVSKAKQAPSRAPVTDHLVLGVTA